MQQQLKAEQGSREQRWVELGEEGVVEVGHFGDYTEGKWPGQM